MLKRYKIAHENVLCLQDGMLCFPARVKSAVYRYGIIGPLWSLLNACIDLINHKTDSRAANTSYDTV